jgi:diadenylate cyclase
VNRVLAELRWTDGLDILIVALLLYALLAWLRRSGSALVATGLGLLAAVYLGARLLELDLTLRVFQSLFAVSLLVAVVVFQEELRAGFEELAAWALRRRHPPRPRLDTRDILVGSLFALARDRVGALVVLPGAQPLDRLCHGGVSLDGELSAPLLESLFDPHSDGHDGAVVVQNRRVTRFGVHLPLSRSHALGDAAGTRHFAALGLSERSDALCLVVSEERGTVSAAHGAHLRAVHSPEELGVVVDRFYRERHPLGQSRPLLSTLFENALPRAAALGMAALLWAVFVPGERLTERSVSIPIELGSLPSELEVQEIAPAEVQATFAGSRRDLLFLDDGSVRLRVDASLAALGRRTFEVDASDVDHPDGLVLRGFSPRKIQISVRKSGG